jgi:hypothetical protein
LRSSSCWSLVWFSVHALHDRGGRLFSRLKIPSFTENSCPQRLPGFPSAIQSLAEQDTMTLQRRLDLVVNTDVAWRTIVHAAAAKITQLPDLHTCQGKMKTMYPHTLFHLCSVSVPSDCGTRSSLQPLSLVQIRSQPGSCSWHAVWPRR